MSALSCGLFLFEERLKLDSNGVVGVLSCDLGFGKGGKALSWGICNTGDTGRLGNGDVVLRRKGILKEDLAPLLCIVGDIGPVVVVTMGFGERRSECRKESTLHDTVSLGMHCG